LFEQNSSVLEKIREVVKPTPIKQRIDLETYKLRSQSNKLQRSIDQMESRESNIHEKCVKALEARDTQTATVFANECVEVRKLLKTSVKSQICLEQAVLRLETIEQFGDMAHGMSMVKGILGSIRRELEGKLPEISTGIGDVEDSLERLTGEIGQTIDADGVSIPSSDESARILREADLVAEQKMREKFPEIPNTATGANKLR